MAKLWRSVCGDTRLLISAASAASSTARLSLPGGDRIGGAASGEQPAVRQHHAAPPACLPPLPQQGEQLGDSMALRSLRPLPCSTRISMRLLSISSTLRPPPPPRAGPRHRRRESRLVLEPRRCIQQSRNLVRAQHHGQLAGLVDERRVLDAIGSPERDPEEEPQCRHGVIENRDMCAVRGQIQLKASDVLEARRVGRSAEERSRTAARTNKMAV